MRELRDASSAKEGESEKSRYSSHRILGVRRVKIITISGRGIWEEKNSKKKESKSHKAI